MIGNMLHDGTRVRQIERAFSDGVDHDVVFADVEVGLAAAVNEVGVKVGCDHQARAADTIGQPERDSPSAASDLQAPPPFDDPKLSEVADRRTVEQSLKRAQPSAFAFPPSVENVGRHEIPGCFASAFESTADRVTRQASTQRGTPHTDASTRLDARRPMPSVWRLLFAYLKHVNRRLADGAGIGPAYAGARPHAKIGDRLVAGRARAQVTRREA
jgi:hypothetical protein